MDNERPTPLVEDIETTRRKLESWLSLQRGQEVHIPALTIPESSGMSNVTLLFDAHWQEGGQSRSEACVGRLQPQIERPVFPAYDLGLQYEVMASLGRHSDIPVPELRGLELDPSLLGVQFYLMKRTPGRIPPDMPPYNMDGWMVHETSGQQRAAMWRAAVDTMGQIHRLDHRALGFGHLEVAGTTPLQQQLGYWQGYLDWALEGGGHAICQAALDWLQASQPAAEPTVLCWGDSRLGNIIFTESLDGIAAVLDWEMAVLGNPVQDLAWFNYLDATFSEGLGMPRLAGLPGYEETISQWEQASGHSARDYDYYLVFAGMRYALILSRIMLATGQVEQVQGSFACQLLEKTMQRLA
ncbi:MAG: phosphotransferase family protein [Gammaproteobacteria bacterium]|nr:phosphotransferase family protein [Gammaproteobacteria bacterium]